MTMSQYWKDLAAGRYAQYEYWLLPRPITGLLGTIYRGHTPTEVKNKEETKILLIIIIEVVVEILMVGVNYLITDHQVMVEVDLQVVEEEMIQVLLKMDIVETTNSKYSQLRHNSLSLPAESFRVRTH